MVIPFPKCQPDPHTGHNGLCLLQDEPHSPCRTYCPTHHCLCLFPLSGHPLSLTSCNVHFSRLSILQEACLGAIAAHLSISGLVSCLHPCHCGLSWDFHALSSWLGREPLLLQEAKEDFHNKQDKWEMVCATLVTCKVLTSTTVSTVCFDKSGQYLLASLQLSLNQHPHACYCSLWVFSL